MKKDQQHFSLIKFQIFVDFKNFSPYASAWNLKYNICHLPLHILAVYPHYLVKCTKSNNVKIGYVEHNTINVLFYFFRRTNKLKCTNVESALKLDTMKVVLLHEHMHTQRRLHHSSVALSMMRCSKQYQPYHNDVHVMNFSEKDPLLKFYANFVVHRVQIWMLQA